MIAAIIFLETTSIPEDLYSWLSGFCGFQLIDTPPNSGGSETPEDLFLLIFFILSDFSQ
jgi:hypothetical protein